MKKKNIILAFIMVLLMQTGVVAASRVENTDRGEVYITDETNVVRRKQLKSDWCWVATAEMVGKYVNPSSAQTQNSAVASMVLEDFDIPGFTFMANIALKKFGGNAIRASEAYGRPLDFGS